ncbi:MAG: aminoacyl-tRNA hydrolase [Candidatus Peribacteraceae bacterium]
MKPELVIVGLGNPGKQYERTRHNAGWMALDWLHKEIKAAEWQLKQKYLATIAEGKMNEKDVLLVKPETYMNDSGNCIRKLVDFFDLDCASQLLVITDDIDLPLGTHRFRKEGGPGTHNGLKSIVQIFGEAFPRHRIGIGPKNEHMDLAAWVLSRMSEEEVTAMQPSIKAITESVSSVSE